VVEVQAILFHIPVRHAPTSVYCHTPVRDIGKAVGLDAFSNQQRIVESLTYPLKTFDYPLLQARVLPWTYGKGRRSVAQGEAGCGVMVLVAYHRGWTREPIGSTMRQHVVSYPPTDIHSLIVSKHSLIVSKHSSWLSSSLFSTRLHLPALSLASSDAGEQG
jgi:hypothetical protein